MDNIPNENYLPNLDNIENEEDQNIYLQNGDFQNLDNNNFNVDVNMNNPNLINYEDYNGEVNNEVDVDKNQIDIENTQAAFVQTLNLQINQLQKLLDEKNKEFDNLNIENNKLKLLLIQEQKKIIDKDNTIHSMNINKKNLEDKINRYKISEEKLNNKIKELNYKIIELNQSLISKENMNQFNNKIKNIIETSSNKDNINNENNALINEKIGVEITKLNNTIDELEIKNNKIVFENKTLNNKISTMLADKNDEINIYKSIYQTQINNLNKIISHLNQKFSELFSEKDLFKTNNKMNNFMSTEIIDKFNALEDKINLYDKENSDLRKENQNIKNELDELKLVAESKEKIIQKLQTDFEMMEKEYNNNSIVPNNMQQIKANEINNNEYTQYINELLNKQNMIENENVNLRNGLKQMTKNINEANEIYFKRKANYDNNIKIRDNKLKEYKNKISLLKMKINELHQEINLLKNNKGIVDNNQNSFLSQNNNDMNKNQFKIEQKNLISHTPKLRRKEIPFDLNLENKDIENQESKDYFGDIKISEVPKITETKERLNTNGYQEDLKYIQEYKDILNKVEEQLNKYN